MSSYTTQLRYLVESEFDIGLKNYPIFDEDYREILNKKIIQHYYFREIGLETAQLFKIFLNNKMNEIMPYYNQMYNSELIKIEPLTRLNYSEDYVSDKTQDTQRTAEDTGTVKDIGTQTLEETGENKSNNSSKNSGKVESIKSDTPTGQLDWNNLENGLYATEVNIGKNNDEVIENGLENNTRNNSQNSKLDRNSKNNTIDNFNLNDKENYIKNIVGNNGIRTDSEMLNEFRTTFLNIDLDVINELENLFIQLW